MSRYCIVVDLDMCTGCQSCEVGCKIENGIALGQKWNKVIERGPFGSFPHIQKYWLPSMCQQCVNAPCQDICPTGATYRDEETGIVLVDGDSCIGCQLCMTACPYEARCLNPEKNIVQKCTLCKQRLDQDQLPMCVSVCPNECRFFGDLDDPESDAAKAVAAADPASLHWLKDTGNGPSTVYILSEKICAWSEEA